MDERTATETDLFQAHFHAGILDPALVWELDRGPSDAQRPVESLAFAVGLEVPR